MQTTTETTQTEQTPNDLAHAAALARRARLVEANTADLLRRYPAILEVVSSGATGPVRVRISCDDPQVRQGVAICETTREIAVQDLFQVHRCEACQNYVVRRARRAKAAARDKALRAAARAAK